MFKFTQLIRVFRKKIPQRILNRLSNEGIPLIVGSVVVGLLSVLFEFLFAETEAFSLEIYHYNKLYFFILSPLTFCLSVYLVRRFAKFSNGSGIPQMLAAIELSETPNNGIISSLLSLKIIVIKILSSVILLFGGGSIGREGPTLQISSSVFYLIHSYFPRLKKIELKTLLITGGASGLGAAFNTPLGGIVYVVEELTKSHINKLKTPVFAAVIIAGFTAQFFTGSYLFLGFPKTGSLGFQLVLLGVFLSILGGILGSLFTILIEKTIALRSSFKNIYVFAAIVGICFSSLIYFTNEYSLGTGKILINDILFGKQQNTDIKIFLGRFFGSLFSFGSGGAGGIFSTSLSTGASLAQFVLSFLTIEKGAYNILILMTMIAFLTGVTRTPFTSAVLVLEMTDRHSAIFYFMMAAIISQFFSERIQKKSFYEKIKEGILSDLKA